MKCHRIIHIVALLHFLLLLCYSSFTLADDDYDEDDDSYIEEQKKYINDLGRQSVDMRLQPLGFGLMGDKIDPHGGTLVFSQTDVSLQGNSALEVAIRRTASTAQKTNREQLFLADWQLQVPSVSMLVASHLGWDKKRCSDTHSIYEDFYYDNQYYSAEALWSGLKLNIPGEGSKLVIENYPYSPGYGQFSEARWGSTTPSRVTKDHWVLTCLDESANSGGEGFLVTAPDGTQYHMDTLFYVPADDRDPGEKPVSMENATLFASRVTDVHGNWVAYHYSDDGKLTSIASNDGRRISLTYVSGTKNIASVTANNRTWTYSYRYVNGTPVALERVTRPDGLYWEYDLSYLVSKKPLTHDCAWDDGTISVKHPFGVTASYTLGEVRIGRSDSISSHYIPYKPFSCWTNVPPGGKYFNFYETIAVKSKTLSGPSIPTSTWRYEYESDIGATGSNAVGETKKTTMIDPLGRRAIYHTYRSGVLQGKVALAEKFDAVTGSLLQRVKNDYAIGSRMGVIEGMHSSHNVLELVTPTYLASRTIERDGDAYYRKYTYVTDPQSTSYSYGKPTSISRWSSVFKDPRTTTITYAHLKGPWVLGLKDTISTNGLEMSSYIYDSLGRLITENRYGEEYASFNYHTIWYPGSIRWVDDALGRRTRFDEYSRGIPQEITRPDGRKIRQHVDANGWVTESEDANRHSTYYDYDSMGRVIKIRHSKKNKDWADTEISYSFEDKIIQIITQGNKQDTIAYDNFLRPLLERARDLLSGNTTYVNTEYDAGGQVVFSSFPSFYAASNVGKKTSYDGLGRVKAVAETVAPYATISRQYLSQHREVVTDANNNATTYYRYGYRGPGKGDLYRITEPLGVNTYSYRNIWGELTRLRQQGNQNGYSVDQSQYFYYDSQRRLCRHRTPEGGDTAYAYDAAGQMIRYAMGLGTSSSCETPSSSSSVSLTYDLMGRVTSTDYADPGTPDINKTYDRNGNVLSTNRGGINWSYTYNDLNQLTSESLDVDGRNYDQTYEYDSVGNLTSHVLPSGRRLDFSLDGFGRAKSVSSGSSYYANAMSYHANGAIAKVTYGNGQVHTQTLNSRLKPSRLHSQKGTTTALDLNYTYDARGDITSIIDATNSANNRALSYDFLGRLETASGAWGSSSFEYDPIGNMRNKTIGTRKVDMAFDSRNRVISSTDSLNGHRSIQYDARGNVTQLGSLRFEYDHAQQPKIVTGSYGIARYDYDGNFKRVRSVVDGNTIYNVFDAAGTLVYVDAVGEGKTTEYIKVAGKSLARITNGVVTYLHANHLGSPTTGTTSTGAIAWKEQYTPFGEKYLSNAANDDLGSFTGHIYDSATGLTYMQARYYDPVIGRFLSIDPLATDPSTPSGMNRYNYANNNPYRFVDPDGWDDLDVNTENLVDVFAHSNDGGAPVDEERGNGIPEIIVYGIRPKEPSLKDFLWQHWDDILMRGGQAIGGVGQMIGGASLCSGTYGLACAGGVLIGAKGADNINAAFGGTNYSLKLLIGLTGDESTATYINAGIDLGTSALGLMNSVPTLNAYGNANRSLFNAIPSDSQAAFRAATKGSLAVEAATATTTLIDAARQE